MFSVNSSSSFSCLTATGFNCLSQCLFCFSLRGTISVSHLALKHNINAPRIYYFNLLNSILHFHRVMTSVDPEAPPEEINCSQRWKTLHLTSDWFTAWHLGWQLIFHITQPIKIYTHTHNTTHIQIGEDIKRMWRAARGQTWPEKRDTVKVERVQIRRKVWDGKRSNHTHT